MRRQGGGQLRQGHVGTQHRVASAAFGQCCANFVGGKKQVRVGGGLIVLGMCRDKPFSAAGVIGFIGNSSLCQLGQGRIQVHFFRLNATLSCRAGYRPDFVACLGWGLELEPDGLVAQRPDEKQIAVVIPQIQC
jgi:hypothetical protein